MSYLFKKLNVIVMGIAVLILCFGVAFGAQKDTQKKSAAQVANEATQAVVPPQAVEVTPAAEAPKAPVKKTKEELAAEKAAQEAATKKMEMIRVAKEKLNNTSWNITLTQSTDKPNKEVIKDTIRFADGKIESERLVANGFSQSNFTLRIKREDKAIWETMQTGKDGELAFWRGEVKRNTEDGTLGDVMNGVLSRHLADKTKTIVDYTFISEEKGEVATEPTTPVTPTKPATPAVAPETAVSTSQPATTTATAGGEVAAPKTGTEVSTAVQKEEKTKKKGLWGR